MEVTDQRYRSLVAKICRDIAVSNWRPDYIVGLTRGGLIPAVMISHYFDIPMYALHVTSNPENNESNLWMSENAYGYEEGNVVNVRKNILIVDDINDTGATLNWIMEDWQSSCLPKDPKWNNIWNSNVRFAVIVDNLASNCSVAMDYIGLEVNKAEEDVWIEFPYEAWWRI